MLNDDQRAGLDEMLYAAIATLSDEDKVRAIEWISSAVDSEDGIQQGIVHGIVVGDYKVAGFGADGEIQFSLTEAGMDSAMELIHTSPELRAMISRLSGKAVVAPPKNPS